MRWDPETYDSVKAPQVEAGRELVKLACVKIADSILDIGCGTGKLTIELARLAPAGSVTGLDQSDDMLLKAAAVSSNVANVNYMKGLAQGMDFKGCYDLAFSNSALHWIRQPEGQKAVIERTFKALRPGGRIAFQMPAMDFCREFFEYAGRAIKANGLERFFMEFEIPWYFPPVKEYEALLQEAGFSAVNVYYKDYRLAFGSIKEVLDWWSSAGLRPYLAVLPEAEQARFKYAFAMEFENNRTARGIELDLRRLFAFAEKRKGAFA
ncbi:MAG: methyltransferase domain-containing protein [Actinomycetota bacterium]|nr:methyltransferase domain-containing protein [Actinomycetota bacterium]